MNPMHARKKPAIFKFAIYATLFVLAGIALGMAKHSLPVYDDDAAWFMPVSVNQASGYGFRNDWFPDADPAGKGRMVWHGFLGNRIAGLLLWNATYSALFMIQALTAVAVLVVSGAMFCKVIPKPEDKGHIGATLVACMLLSGLLPSFFSGRPEPFASLILVLTVLTLQRTPAGRHSMIIGVGLAFLAVTQPTVALIGVPLSGVYLSCVFRPRRMVSEFAKSGLLALPLTVFMAYLLHPYGISDWISGVSHHAQRTQGFWSASLIWFWFLRPDRFAYGVWYVAAFIALVFLFIHNKRRMASPVFALLFGCATMMALWRFGVWVPATNYNVIAYAPIVCLILLYTFSRIATKPGTGIVFRRFVLLLLLGTAAVPSIGAIRFMLHPVASREAGLPYAVAQQRLNDLLDEHHRVGVSTGLFTLADDQSNIEHIWLLKMNPESAAIMIQQVNTGRRTPPEIEGYILQEDRFSRESPKLFGLPTGNTPAGYNYAIYLKDTGN